MELRGETVLLRPFIEGDVEAVAKIHAEPGVARWWGRPEIDKLRRKAEGREGSTAFVIEVDGTLAGLIQYHEEDHPRYRHAGIDLFLAKEFQGRGLGTDAIRTLARFLVDARGHHRFTIDPAAENVPAIRAYEKAGFRRVGVMRRYEREPDADRWHDGLLMELLADDLSANPSGPKPR